MRKNVERKGGLRASGVGIERTIVVAILVHAAIVAVFARRTVERAKPPVATAWTPREASSSPEIDPTETEVTLEEAPAPRDETSRRDVVARESVAAPRPGEASSEVAAASKNLSKSASNATSSAATASAARPVENATAAASPRSAASTKGVTFGGAADVPARVDTGLDVFAHRTPLSPADRAPSDAAAASSSEAASSGGAAAAVDRAAASSRALALSLRSAAREREHELGLGPEGPVLTALRSATSATTTPVTGRAVFLARANHDGLVTLLELSSCDGAREGWMDAARAALRALQTKKLRIPSYAKLAEMTIAVSSGWKMPNGHDPGTDVTAMQVPVTRGAEGKNGTTMDILNVKIDRVRLNRDLTIPVPATRLDVVATNGDSSNLGAKPRRIVHTELLDVKLL